MKLALKMPEGALAAPFSPKWPVFLKAALVAQHRKTGKKLGWDILVDYLCVASYLTAGCAK